MLQYWEIMYLFFFLKSSTFFSLHDFLFYRIHRFTTCKHGSLSLWNQYTDGFYYLALKVLPIDNRFDSVTHTPFRNYASKSIHQIRITIFIVWKIVESEVNVIVVFNGNGWNDFASFANGSF